MKTTKYQKKGQHGLSIGHVMQLIQLQTTEKQKPSKKIYNRKREKSVNY